MLVAGRTNQAFVSLTDGPLVSGHRPSIDMLFQSAARIFGGCNGRDYHDRDGADGVEGCKRILAAGGTTFGQDEATSVVYGMNKICAFIEGAVRAQISGRGTPGSD